MDQWSGEGWMNNEKIHRRNHHQSSLASLYQLRLFTCTHPPTYLALCRDLCLCIVGAIVVITLALFDCHERELDDCVKRFVGKQPSLVARVEKGHVPWSITSRSGATTNLKSRKGIKKMEFVTDRHLRCMSA